MSILRERVLRRWKERVDKVAIAVMTSVGVGDEVEVEVVDGELEVRKVRSIEKTGCSCSSRRGIRWKKYFDQQSSRECTNVKKKPKKKKWEK